MNLDLMQSNQFTILAKWKFCAKKMRDFNMKLRIALKQSRI